MTQRLWLASVLFGVVACTPRVRPESTPAVSAVEPVPIAVLAARIDADAQQSDHVSDARIRDDLAAAADHDAADCLAREPQAAPCLYGRAVAQGLMARAHPTRAGGYLTSMLDSLARAETADPDYDEAGPARVRALVLLRAPGWPLGPGDSEAGLVAARRAVALRPLYPPNLLALAEALAASGDAIGARENYAHARAAALALPAAAAGSSAADAPAAPHRPSAADRDEWLRQAEAGLRQK